MALVSLHGQYIKIFQVINMINQNSITAVENSKFGEQFVKPLYGSYCFSGIPNTIISAFGKDTYKGLPADVLPTKKQYQKVVLLFVDAFGWKFFEQNKNKYPALQRFVNRGMVSKITSQFPSTTPVHVTTINTGLNVGEHGVYEWLYYEPKLDAVIAPLLFSFAKDKQRGTLASIEKNPDELYPDKTFYQTLNKLGIKSYLLNNSEYINTPYNNSIGRGATETIPWDNSTEAFGLLSQKLLQETEKAYFLFYFGKIDSAGHDFGPDSKEFTNEIEDYFTALEDKFFKIIEGRIEDTLILLTADHGQTQMRPRETIYINQLIPEIADYFLETKTGNPIVPAGSCRDMFLHVKEERLTELKGMLEEKLNGIAEVYKTSDLVAKGFFGKDEPSKEFKERVGNLVILPYSGQGVWWYEKGVFEQEHLGHHGGLTREEVEIPFLALPF